jgi:MFS family permease
VSGRVSILAPFKVRGFLFQWPADLFTNWGIEMEILILGWYVMLETKSVLLLAVFGSLRYLGTLIAPGFGMAGDKFGHRNVLCAMRAVYAALAAVMMALAYSEALEPWHVFVVSTLSGLVRPSDLAMRNALIAAIVPGPQLMGAMGVARTTSDVARIGGPLFGAAAMAAMAMGHVYLSVTLVYALGLSLTFLGGAGLAHRRSALVGRASFLRETFEGLAYVWRTPCLHAGMWLAFLVNMTAFPISGNLLPYIAYEIYGTNQTGLGLLTACFAAGAFCGSIFLSAFGQGWPTGRTMIVAALLWYALLTVFVFMPDAVSGGAMLVASGCAQSISMVALAVMLLRVAGEQYRGRIMGVRMLAIYGLPVGLLASGYLIRWFGYLPVAAGYCLFGIAATLAIALWWRRAIWPLDAPGNAVGAGR